MELNPNGLQHMIFKPTLLNPNGIEPTVFNPMGLHPHKIQPHIIQPIWDSTYTGLKPYH